MKKTKIIATVWPVTQSKEQLEKMYHSWVNIVRFNFSHATFDGARPIADTIKELNKEWKTQLSLLLDTKWPEIRTEMVEKKIELIAWNNGSFSNIDVNINSINVNSTNYTIHSTVRFDIK